MQGRAQITRQREPLLLDNARLGLSPPALWLIPRPAVMVTCRLLEIRLHKARPEPAGSPSLRPALLLSWQLS